MAHPIFTGNADYCASLSVPWADDIAVRQDYVFKMRDIVGVSFEEITPVNAESAPVGKPAVISGPTIANWRDQRLYFNIDCLTIF